MVRRRSWVRFPPWAPFPLPCMDFCRQMAGHREDGSDLPGAKPQSSRGSAWPPPLPARLISASPARQPPQGQPYGVGTSGPAFRARVRSASPSPVSRNVYSRQGGTRDDPGDTSRLEEGPAPAEIAAALSPFKLWWCRPRHKRLGKRATQLVQRSTNSLTIRRGARMMAAWPIVLLPLSFSTTTAGRP